MVRLLKSQVLFDLFSGIKCECKKNHVNVPGEGSCQIISTAPQHKGNKMCHVEQPSSCSDLVEDLGGEYYSVQACDNIGETLNHGYGQKLLR